MKAHKIELKPNNKQITYFKKASGLSRLAWNWGLSKWEKYYENGISVNGKKLRKEFNSIKKKEFPFTYEVTKCASNQPFLDLQKAYERFFKKISDKPKLKKKGKSKDSFYISGIYLKVSNKKVHIPKLGWVRMREPLRYEGKILNATVSRVANKWFISFQVEPLISYSETCESQASVGVDLGIKHFMVLSNGGYIDNPMPLKRKLKKLRRLSRQLSRKQHPRKKGDTTKVSNNYKKHKLKISKLHYQISNIRKDFLHKVTTYLTSNFKYISIEDLSVKGMMKNSKLSRAISDVGMYEFRRQLEYKSKDKGNHLLINDKWFASSKNCPNCGCKKDDLTLKDRVYECSHCGLVGDRDYVASINLHNQLPRVHRKVKPVETLALNFKAGLRNLTKVIEVGSKHNLQLVVVKNC